DTVKELVKAGVDVNQTIEYYKTAGRGEGSMDYLATASILEYAVEHNCKDLVHELLQGKPKIDSFEKTVNMIKKKFGLQTKVDVLDQALIVAAQNRSIKIMQELVLAGADINYADKDGNTALIKFVGRSLHIPNSCSRDSNYIESCKQFRIDGVQYLLSVSGININHANNDGNTALIQAVKNSNFEAVQVLLQASNIDINYANHNGNTALIEALLCVQTSYVSSDVNQYYRCKNSQSIVEALLANPKIDVYHVNKKGNTAIKLLDQLKKERMATKVL
ncbi:MAG: ankyrin repeat domain-containing protein, partial [Candidatus Chromulinivorax sp.]